MTRASLRGVDIVFTPDPKLVAELASRAEFRIVQKATAEGEKDATTDSQAPGTDGSTATPPTGGNSGQPSGDDLPPAE